MLFTPYRYLTNNKTAYDEHRQWREDYVGRNTNIVTETDRRQRNKALSQSWQVIYLIFYIVINSYSIML